MIKLSKIKGKENFERNKIEKNYHIKGNPHKIISKFVTENVVTDQESEWNTQSAGRKWKTGTQVKLFLRNEGEIEMFSDKQKSKEFIITQLAL